LLPKMLLWARLLLEMKMEEWRPIYGFPDYEVSSLGRARRVTPYPHHPNRKPGLMKQSLSVRGYYRFKLAAPDGTFKHRFVHNLMAQAFLPNPGRHASVCHNNGVKTDNRMENLRWDSQHGNIKDKEKHGTSNSGEKNGHARLTQEQVLEIRDMNESGATYASLGDIYGVSGAQIGRICRGEKWKSVGGATAKKYS
jgi:hypothetical protein